MFCNFNETKKKSLDLQYRAVINELVASNVLFDFSQLGKPQFIVLGSVQIRVVRLLN
jgi:hypothetical protein